VARFALGHGVGSRRLVRLYGVAEAMSHIKVARFGEIRMPDVGTIVKCAAVKDAEMCRAQVSPA
jgi:hypothetical protein